MLGMPKFRKGQSVEFTISGKLVQGRIAIIDAYGTFEQDEEVSYDIFSTDNILYKHIRESGLRAI